MLQRFSPQFLEILNIFSFFLFRLEISLVYPLLECDFLGDVKKNIQEQVQENPKPPWTPSPPGLRHRWWFLIVLFGFWLNILRMVAMPRDCFALTHFGLVLPTMMVGGSLALAFLSHPTSSPSSIWSMITLSSQWKHKSIWCLWIEYM